jgi:hypothetical protein
MNMLTTRATMTTITASPAKRYGDSMIVILILSTDFSLMAHAPDLQPISSRNDRETPDA